MRPSGEIKEDVAKGRELFCICNEFIISEEDVREALCLIESGAKLNVKIKGGETTLMQASRNGHAAIVAQLIAAKVKLDEKDDNGWTAMHYAARFGKPDVVEMLAIAGLPLDERTGKNWTPLMLASWSDGTQGIETVKKLLALGARIDAQDDEGQTALHIADSEGKRMNCYKRIRIAAFIRAARIEQRESFIKAGLPLEKPVQSASRIHVRKRTS